MEQQLGDNTWDISADHKGKWCLYRSQFCQEDSGCIGCEIHVQAEKKWQELMEDFKWAS